MTEDRTALQTLIQEQNATELVIADLSELQDEYSDEDETKEWELSVKFTLEEIPIIISELEELTDE